MSLQLSKNKPRQLQYAAGGLREDYTLLELDENLLDTIIRDQCVVEHLSATAAELRWRATEYRQHAVQSCHKGRSR